MVEEGLKARNWPNKRHSDLRYVGTYLDLNATWLSNPNHRMQTNIGDKRETAGKYGDKNQNNNNHINGISNAPNQELDVIIVGAGFAGVYLLHLLRKEGLKAKIIEAGYGLGGVWYWNSYPGARVDCPYPAYALNIPEVYSTWTWREDYPSDKELREYFQHIDNVLDISRDVVYGQKVVEAEFDESRDTWTVKTNGSSTFYGQFFCPCIGFATKRLFPEWRGLKDVYNGRVLHSSFWPSGGIDLHDKKVAIVGTGATGVQLAQTVARDAAQLTCFVRTPNLTWPMRLKRIDPDQERADKKALPYLLGEKRYTTVGGFVLDETSRKVFDDTPEKREARLEQDYRDGGYRMFFCSYIDILMSEAGNKEIYNFWRRKVHSRMTDQTKAEILAPVEQPHPFAGKRPSLEQDYYEQMDMPHVTLVDVKRHPIIHLVEDGIVTADGTIHRADLIVLATGFDAATGGLKDITITGLGGLTLQDRWKDGTHAYLGMMVSGLPNLFYTYGPFAPTAYASGPVVVESQATWIIQVMKKMRRDSLTRIDVTREAEASWKEKVLRLHAMTLRENVEGSWYLGYVLTSLFYCDCSLIPKRHTEPLQSERTREKT